MSEQESGGTVQSPDRSWLGADSLRVAVENLAEEARRADDFPEDAFYADQLEAILAEHKGGGVDA